MVIGILGASGQLGRRTVEAVLARNVPAGDVIAMTRTPDTLEELAARGVDVRRADYDDLPSLGTAFMGVERLLLVPSMAMPVERVRQFENALTAALAAGVRHVVHYGLVPTVLESPFAVTPFLLYAESALRLSGLAWTVFRNSLYADPIAEWVPRIVEMGTIPYPTGLGRCAFVTRDDIARAAAAVLAADSDVHEGAIYNLTGPDALTTADLCAAVARVTGEKVVDRGAGDDEFLAACAKDGLPPVEARLLLSLYHAIAEGHLDVVTDDVARLTGRPAERFESFLRRSKPA